MQPGMTPTGTDRAAMGHEDPRRAAVLAEMKSRLGAKPFALWCEDKINLEIRDDVLAIAVGSPFLLNCMQKQFGPALTATAQAVLGPSATAVMTVDARLSLSGSMPVEHRRQKASAKAVAAAVTLPAEPKAVAEPTVRLATAVESTTSPAALPRQRRLAELSEYIAGPSTEIAVTACRQVAISPGLQFNPLYLHGAVGTGKSHLLEGICRQLRRSHPNLQVVLITAEGFANYFTQSLRDRTLPSFRQKFRGVDLLLVDDVDFFESKRVFQEEFLHTLADLIDHRRQVVMTGDRHPRLLAKLGDDLISRLQSGLVCRLETPDAETRRKIVTAKAARLDGEFAPEALDFIADRFTGSVRELEGALNCLQTYFAMTRQRITLSIARQVLADLERDCLRIVRLADVERVVCQLFGLRPKDLKSDSRVRTLAQPRMLAMFLARKHTPSAYSEIGQHFGGRNHSTVMSAERKVQGWLEENATVRIAAQDWTIGEIVSTLEQQLLAG
ncbi:MAG TPA: chromosomal replication initiator protein DnaA [Planctomycetaceae bacterium]|nr:chromosomal replication initiator protein DnaA [Planctomycetaceae bacterium]